jgi:hypothetical protein
MYVLAFPSPPPLRKSWCGLVNISSFCPLLPHCPLLLVLIGEISQSVEEEPEKQEWRFAIEYAKQNKNKSK